jgi:hypothetical protein
MKYYMSLFLAAVLFARPATTNAEVESAELECGKSSAFLAPPENMSARHYAPDAGFQTARH